jgi:ubiquinone/menaquinone biosynthesis C-methylase UbiE
VARRGPARWFFDAWSLAYDQPLVQWLTYRPVHDAVLAELRALAPRTVVDVGCGTGLLTTRLVHELANVHVVGLDFSAGMLAHARARSRAVPWVCGDALRLPLRDASADAIVSTEAFHWFPDQPAALAEFRRVLRPGGRALVAIVNTPTAGVRAIVRAGSAVVGQPFDWPTRAEMRALFERAGLRIGGQRRVYRLPAGVLLPPVLTIGVRDR